LGTLLFVQNRIAERRDTFLGIGIIQRVIRVRHITQVLFSHKLIEIELRRVWKKILITCRVDDIFWHRYALAMKVRIVDL